MTNEIKKGKKENLRRTIPVQVFLSEDEHKLLSEKCKDNGMTMSYFFRKTITDEEIGHSDTIALGEIVQELNSIGNDINAIAKKVNERGNVIEEDNEKLTIKYEQLIEMFLDKVMGVN